MFLSGMWMSTIFVDRADGSSITPTQYFMTVLTLFVGISQFALIANHIVL